EEVLGIRTVSMTWPFGPGQDFAGVATLFDKPGPDARRRPLEQIIATLPPIPPGGVSDPDKLKAKLAEEVELLAHAGDPFDRARILRGELSPAFFGSAWNEKGVDEFLAAFVGLAPAPGPRHTTTGEAVDPLAPAFSGFVFKIQANMDPAHRDRLAFLRVCSGRFERGMTVRNVRDEKDMRLSMPHQLFALRDGGLRDPILGAVGALQLEVLQYRLSHEYGAEIALDRLPYTVARWIQGTGFDPSSFEQEVDALCVVDRDQNPLALFKSEWNLSYAQGRHPQWTFSPTAMTKSR